MPPAMTVRWSCSTSTILAGCCAAIWHHAHRQPAGHHHPDPLRGGHVRARVPEPDRRSDRRHRTGPSRRQAPRPRRRCGHPRVRHPVLCDAGVLPGTDAQARLRGVAQPCCPHPVVPASPATCNSRGWCRHGFYIIDAFQLGDMSVLVDVLRHAVLPALALGLLTAGVFIRLVRTTSSPRTRPATSRRRAPAACRRAVCCPSTPGAPQ